MPRTRYKIRNRLLEPVGEYSAKEILARIVKGRFTGEEEVSAPPYERWQKLAAHPAFYDAFIKRIYSEGYQSPDGEPDIDDSSLVDKKKAKAGKTKHGVAEDSSSPEPADSGKTHQVVNPGTIHQSEIDELFSAPSEMPAGTQMNVIGKTSVLALDKPPEQPIELQPIEAPLAGATPASPSVPEEAALLLKRARKKKVIYGAVAALVLLYLFSSDTPRSDITSGVDPKAAVGLLGSSASPEERALTLSDEAAALMIQDTLLFYQGAYDVLREALDLDQNNTSALSRIAIASARMAVTPEEAKTRKAEIGQVLRRARSTDPHSSELYRAEAILAQAEQKTEEAKTFALKAAESDPVSAENLLLIGELHLANGNVAEARSALQEAVAADPKRVRARYFLARAHWEAGDITAAHQEAIESLKLNPLHPPTYLILAEVAARQNQFKEARGLFETCGRLARFTTPDVSGQAFYRLAELHELAGNTAEANNSYQLAYYYLKGGDAALAAKVGKLDVSKDNLKKMAAQAEYQSAYFREQGTGLLTQGKTEEAVRFFQAAHLLSPKDGLALIQLGEVMEKTASSYEDFRRVMSYYQRAIDRDPTEAMGYIKLGLLESEQYNFDRGYKLLMQAVALAPESEKPYVALGKHFYKRQDYNEALNQFLKAAKINYGDSEILYYAGKLRLVYKKDGARDAVKFFSQAYTVDPRNYDALVEWLKLKVVNYEKNFAVKMVNNLIAAEPNNPMLYWVLGEVYAENKEYQRAITHYHKSLDLDNRQSKVRMSLAKSLESVGELDKAVAEFRLSSLLDRRNSEGFYRAADLLFQMKSYQQAEEVLKFLVSVTPNYPGTHRYLSKIYALRDQKDAAVEAMQKEVANNPQNYKFVLELAELLLDYERFDAAIAELKKVTNLPSAEQAPEFKAEKIRAYLLLSRCYRAKSQFENAEAAVRLAITQDANDPELHRELGYVYYSMQRDVEGVKAFEFYLERNPAARDAPAIRNLIKKMVIEQ